MIHARTKWFTAFSLNEKEKRLQYTHKGIQRCSPKYHSRFSSIYVYMEISAELVTVIYKKLQLLESLF